ncbi:MAG: sensor histidine kinase, partial [Longimicrobiales bacterium]
EPSSQDILPARLAGPEGLDLVVEVAHDLRSPLTSIMFLAETMRKGQTGAINDVQKKQLGIIYSAGFGLLSVATDMIEMARGDSQRDVEPASFSLSEVFESVRAMVATMAEEKGLDLEFVVPENDLRTGRAVALSRVLLNLVTNAIKFTDEGFIEVTARARGRNRVVFSVRDTGPGIGETRRSCLYQPFRRRAQGTGFRVSGTGLGLSICRRLVESMGGTLQVESDPEWGTRFSFELQLPVAPRSAVI